MSDGKAVKKAREILKKVKSAQKTLDLMYRIKNSKNTIRLRELIDSVTHKLSIPRTMEEGLRDFREGLDKLYRDLDIRKRKEDFGKSDDKIGTLEDIGEAAVIIRPHSIRRALKELMDAYDGIEELISDPAVKDKEAVLDAVQEIREQYRNDADRARKTRESRRAFCLEICDDWEMIIRVLHTLIRMILEKKIKPKKDDDNKSSRVHPCTAMCSTKTDPCSRKTRNAGYCYQHC